MSNSVDIKVLRDVTNRIFDFIEHELKIKEVELPHNFYWSMSDDVLYKMDQQPPELDCGSRQKIQRSLTDKSKLQQRLDALHPAVGTQQGGYDFQDWFYDLLDFCEIENRRPYVSAGRQIDGSLTVDGTTYLVELKFTGEQSGAPDIDSLRSKVDDKADNTMGIMLSISGYSSVAVTQASGRKTTLMLFDAFHFICFCRA